MNVQHFRTFLWLRWRLFANQLTRGGILGKIVLAIGAVGAFVLTIALLVNSVIIGWLVLPGAPPVVLLLVWDGIIAAFLFSWSIGLIQELQRSEALALDRFLHLPVSLSGVFVLNYLSSLVCLTIVLFVPAMIGLSIGLAVGKGPALALQLPAAAAFVFMVTALSYQFQGWLAALMVNKRRRRTIIVMVTLAFILLFQLPNLINIFRPWDVDTADRRQRSELKQKLDAKEITFAEYQKQIAEDAHTRHERGTAKLRMLEDAAWLANMIVPLGWLAWGSASAMEGNPLPALLAISAYALVGGLSLWRSYRTTLRIYTGQFTAGAAAAPRSTAEAPGIEPPQAPPTPTIPAFLEKTIPGLSEQAAAIALTGFRSLLRAPEAKMLLLSPIIMVVIFGGMFLRGGVPVPDVVRPLIAFGAMTMIFFTMVGIAGNQFGFDRAGFRIFVLSPAPRRDILLGKNFAVAPIVLALTVPILVVVVLLLPMPIHHLLALPFQWMSLFLIWSLSANLLSILAPMPMAVGSMKPLSPRFVPMLLHMAFMFGLPIALSPVLLPWGIETLLNALDWSWGMPICLVLTMLESAAIVWLYRVVIRWEGTLLQRREQQILEAVVAKAE